MSSAPDLDVAKMVEGAMKMREASEALIKLEYLGATTPEEVKIIDDLAEVIKGQMKMIDFMTEAYINLAELMDSTFEVLDRAIRETGEKT